MIRRQSWKIGFVALAAVGAAFGAIGLIDWSRGGDFDPDGWQDPALIKRGIRLRMADDLIARDLLRGKTRAEVIEMLGEPTESRSFDDWDMAYQLGPERGLIRLDYEWLVVRLGADGQVAEYRTVRQ